MNDSGIIKRKDGYWGYRFSVTINGKQIWRRKYTDEEGNLITSKKSAISEKYKALARLQIEGLPNQKIKRITIEDLYSEYCRNGRSDKAFSTILKQDSLWENHLKKDFGNKYVDSITIAEVNDYLSHKYYDENYSYSFTESFLKMFYLLLGQAYSRNYLDLDSYNKLCITKNTKIHMPKLKVDDDSDIVIYSYAQLKLLDKYFENTSVETAYMLGRYCGLRISETFGLKWDKVDLDSGTITIDRQMQYQESLIKLVPVKTRNGNRVIHIPNILIAYLIDEIDKRARYEYELSDVRSQNRRLIKDLDGSLIPSTDMVNCFPDGKLQTTNSFKYHSREIKSKYNIEFKYHYLRHTYASNMAALNTPQHLLCNQMGHSSINVTQKYYLNASEKAIEILRNNVNNL